MKNLNGFTSHATANIFFYFLLLWHKSFIKHLKNAVANGDVRQERIDDAVARILKAKFLLGVFEKPVSDGIHTDLFGSGMIMAGMQNGRHTKMCAGRFHLFSA